MAFEDILAVPPYSLNREEKNKILTERLTELTDRHRNACVEYDRILRAVGYEHAVTYKDIPFLPVRLFKERSLRSVPEEEVVKTMTSSGTSGQQVSKIYLDKITASNQQKVMAKIVADFTDSSRMPMIILDCPSVLKDRKKFSARGAGILGFSIFGSKKIYALNDDMQLDIEGMKAFLEKYKGQRILLFGFTFMIWQHFYQELVTYKEKTGESIDLSNGILIHGGGWKKLISEAVSPEEFHDRLKEICGLEHIHDYYGMVEQTGCIYMQCECGHLHASNFSDVIIRNPVDFSECQIGEKGIIQVVSTIPESYPGHSLLTEDEGIIVGEDDCACGRKGKYFRVLGRIKNAEIRGCSDTYAADHGRGAADAPDCRIAFLIGEETQLDAMKELPPMKPFSPEILDFLADLSRELMSSAEAKSYPDIMTLGFWLRNSSLEQLRKRFIKDSLLRFGRGVVFHVAPSNVPVNYAYSLFAGLLCGNANIVRVPSKNFPQIDIINQAMKKVFQRHENIKPYIMLVRYERDKEINDRLSALCDVRVIWGGDMTISALRESALPPRSTEITFADRYSLAVIDADAYLEIADKERTAADFYNDTYLSDQNACTSPRLVIWTGRQKAEARQKFWKELLNVAKEKYLFQPIQSINKLSTVYKAAMDHAGGIKVLSGGGNMLMRVQLESLPPDIMDYRGDSGCFYEYECDDILDLKALCNDNRCQTIGLVGDLNLLQPLLESGIKGIDRVVRLGRTMDFDLLWDGYDLTERLTRTITI